MIAIIPARGGSKGVPKKNIRNLAGKPNIVWSIKACLQSKLIRDVIVTTESEEIATIAKNAGARVPLLRPKNLATDDVPNGFACLHTVDFLESTEEKPIESFAIIQATCPLITPQDINNAVQIFYSKKSSSVISVVKTETPLESVGTIDADGKFISVLRDNYGIDFVAGRRQNFGERVALSGAITVVNTALMRADVNYFWASRDADVYALDDFNGLDIDTELDFEFANFLMCRRLNL